MTDCEKALELISERLDGPLAAEDAAWLAAHLDACPDCRALQADFAALHQQLPLLAARPPEELKDKVMEAVHASKVTPFQGKKKQWQWRSLASLAAVLALVFIGGYGLRQWDSGARITAGGEAAPAAQAASVEDAAEGEAPGELAREITPYGQKTLEDPAGEPEGNATPLPQTEALPQEAEASVTLTMDALPEGWQEVLPGVANPDGAVVTCQQAQALADLLERQGISAAVEGDLYGKGDCRLLLADK